MLTPAQTAAYQAAFDHFNATLFGGELPHVILNFSRHAKSLGFFAPERWSESGPEGEDGIHEISLNPAHLADRSPRETLSTLVHEMAHLWQQVHGKPSRSGYHNREWADKMEAIGLMPSSTAAPGGARTGQRVSHYIIEGGAFDRAFQAAPESCKLPYVCSDGARAARGVRKTPYTCSCGVKVWGKGGLRVICGECGELLEQEPQG